RRRPRDHPEPHHRPGPAPDGRRRPFRRRLRHSRCRKEEWMRLALATLLLPLSIALAGCGEGAAKQKENAPAPPPNVVVTTVVQRDQPIVREWIGTTEGDVNADIRPKIEGYLMRRAYQEGSAVHRGQLLFEIDPRQAEAQLRQAEANLEQAKAG